MTVDVQILYYSSSECSPCKVINENLKGMTDNLNKCIRKYDVVDDAALAMIHSVRSVPCMILSIDCIVNDHAVGYKDCMKLLKFTEDLFC